MVIEHKVYSLPIYIHASFKHVHKFDQEFDRYYRQIDRVKNGFDRVYIEIDHYKIYK